ncbi:hypothetical protein [Tenacibaculum aiptasiae]|uniref:hypothetical protein n=1 Tax=Tenacibaculum aiptasiae TaxID=426481 RepID=UPI00232C9879|nr:hypothetical protein [Tenacibaculum aiptasiae]
MKNITILNNSTTLVLILTLSFFSSCKNNLKPVVTKQSVLSDYSVGEKWVWKYKGISGEGEVRSNGTDTRKVVDFNGELGMTIDKDTVLLSEIVKPEESSTPKYKWPLKVGEKWKFENNFTSQDGTKGTFSQNAKVISYEKVTVEAGTFMAYIIDYKGKITNSRGYNAKTDEVWIYAPKVKNFIKMTQIQDGFSYTEELIEYSK